MIDIIDIYAKYGVKLQNSGNKYKSPCPFHTEKKPSFFVYADGSYHCFGCGMHGTIDMFINKFDKSINKQLLAKSLDMVSDTRYTNNMIVALEKKLLLLLKEKDIGISYKIWKQFDENFAIYHDDTNDLTPKRVIDFLNSLEGII